MIIAGTIQTSFPTIKASDVRAGVNIGDAVGTLPANQAVPQGTGVSAGRAGVVLSGGAVLQGASQ